MSAENQFNPMQPVSWDCVVQDREELFTNPDWCAQEKLNGEKVIIVSTRGELRGFYRSGKSAALSAKTRAFMPVSGSFVVEGEQGNLVTGDSGFVAFDILSIEGQSVEHLFYDDRLDALASTGVSMITTFFGERAKRAAFERIASAGGEGMVFKQTLAHYMHGATTMQVKLKNWKSDTFRVSSVDGKGMEIETLCGKPAGRCAGFALPGQLVEVQYQEVTVNRKLRSPVLLRVRNDI